MSCITYGFRAILGWMNIHVPPMLMFTRGFQAFDNHSHVFDPQPFASFLVAHFSFGRARLAMISMAPFRGGLLMDATSSPPCWHPGCAPGAQENGRSSLETAQLLALVVGFKGEAEREPCRCGFLLVASLNQKRGPPFGHPGPPGKSEGLPQHTNQSAASDVTRWTIAFVCGTP